MPQNKRPVDQVKQEQHDVAKDGRNAVLTHKPDAANKKPPMKRDTDKPSADHNGKHNTAPRGGTGEADQADDADQSDQSDETGKTQTNSGQREKAAQKSGSNAKR